MVPARATAVVNGHAFWCEKEIHFQNLELYESEHYTWDWVDVHFKPTLPAGKALVQGENDGQGQGQRQRQGMLVRGRVFVWASGPDDPELTDGVWAPSWNNAC